MIEEVYKEYSFTTPKDGEPDLAYSSCCLEFFIVGHVTHFHSMGDHFDSGM
jgi:hypothetical protein